MKNKGMILKACAYFLIVILGTMSILAACAEPAPAPAPTPAPSPAPAPSPTPAPSPAPAPTPTPPTKLIVAIPTDPQTMDPCTSKFFPANRPALENIYDTLIGSTRDQKPDPNFGLASWEILEDGKVYEFTLRQGVKFHSGDPLSTKDVEFSLNRSMENNPEFPPMLRNLDRLEIIDDYKIRFIFKVPDVLFLFNRLLLIASKSYYDRVGEDEFISNPSGTGPYKFVEWKPGQYLDLVANEDYWGGAPTVKQVRFVFAKEETTRVAMLQAGEVDIITSVPWAVVGDLEKAGFKTSKLPSFPDTAVQFHTSNPNVPWYDKRVRRAIAYAIDRESIVKNVFYGIPKILAWLAPTDLGYEPEIKPYPYDPAKAKELLAEAGYPDGFEMPLYYQVGGGMAGSKEVTEAVVLYLNAVGIKCNLIGLEGPKMQEYTRKWNADPTAEAVAISSPSVAFWPDPVRGIQMGYYSKSGLSLYSNPEVDALIEEALITVDNTKRGEVIKQIIRIMDDEVPSAAILSNVNICAMKPNIDFSLSLAYGFYIKHVTVMD